MKPNMKNITKQLKQGFSQYDSIEERFELLKDKYKGETAYLVTCGPTLTTHDQQILKEKLKNKLVICAKQSFNYLNDICDFHLMSVYGFQPYTYSNPNTIVSWQLTGCNMNEELNKIANQWKQKIDLYFPVISGPWITIEGTTAFTRNFDNWKRLGTDTQVMWGPGILYESGFPLCYHLGVNKIVTIGWDIGDLSKFKPENGYQLGDNAWRKEHSTDLYSPQANPGAGPDYTELKNTIECTSAMYDWFEKENTKVQILSDTNPADKRFERINIEQL